MSSRIFQSVVMQMRDAVHRPVGVLDEQGNVIACSDLSLMGVSLKSINASEHDKLNDVFTVEGKTCRSIPENGRRSEYFAFVDGTDDLAASVCVVAAIALGEAKSNYDDKHDTAAFVKNIISDNILPGDVYIRARELHFNTDAARGVFVIRRSEDNSGPIHEYLQSNFVTAGKDFLLSVSETDCVLIKELSSGYEKTGLFPMAEEIYQGIRRTLGLDVNIGIGSPVLHLRELADRYKEAQTALEVGKVFDNDKPVISYENLGIGRIVYQLPTTLCEMFLSEVFKKNPIESLDQETLYTINKFFENNLNVSETSRKLFVHRNTLVYRLEKIKKLTGLDLREFDHAIIFKVALMVKKYLDTQSIHY